VAVPAAAPPSAGGATTATTRKEVDAGAGAGAGGEQRPFREIYAERLRRDVSMMPAGSYPAVEVAYDNLSYALHLPKAAASRELNNVGTAFLNIFRGPMRSAISLASRLASGEAGTSSSE